LAARNLGNCQNQDNLHIIELSLSTTMKSTIGLALALPLSAAAAALERRCSVNGFDISSYQPNVDFTTAKDDGLEFVIIKATEGTNLKDPDFSEHYEGATNAGLIRGGYHFAHPSESSGAVQAEFFHSNGGGWTSDGRTLPGMVDLESGTSEGSTECWGLTTSEMISWISSFVDKYNDLAGRPPMIYTSPSWWSTCTGDSTAFHANCPLVLADWASSISSIPGEWPYQTIWQNADSNGAIGGDHDIFNGDMTQLKKFATG